MTRSEMASLAWLDTFERQRRDRDEVRTERDGEGSVSALGYPLVTPDGGPREAAAERRRRYST